MEYNLDFLSNFQKRMEFIAPVALISQKVSDRSKYREYDLFSITFVLLDLLKELALQEDDADVDDMGDFIKFLLLSQYKLKIGSEVASDMAKFIVEEILENGGEMLRISIPNFETGKNTEKIFKLVEVKNIQIGKKNRYRATYSAIELFFRTDEVDREMRISMQTFIIKQKIQKGHYDKALAQIRNLRGMAIQLGSRIDNFEYNMRLNIMQIESREINELRSDIQKEFEVEKRDFGEIFGIIDERKSEIEAHPEIYNDKDEYDDMLLKLECIAQSLNSIIAYYNDVIIKAQKLTNIYREELENKMALGLTSQYDFKAMKNALESNIIPIDNVLSLLKPMLKFKYHKNFNLDKIFSEQIVVGNKIQEKEDSNKIYFPEDINVTEKSDVNKQYIDALNSVFTFMLNNNIKKLLLSEYLEKLKLYTEDYFEELITNNSIFKLVSIIYSRAGSKLNIHEVYSNARRLEFKEELSDFNTLFIINVLMDMDTRFKSLRYLKIVKSGDEVKQVISNSKIVAFNDAILLLE